MFNENKKEARFVLASSILVGMAASGKIGVKQVDKEAVKAAYAYADEMIKQAESEDNDETTGT